ncbi:MAG: multicopper oxidase domain-containing protein [Candidatus Krumholzibacteriia bacterium]
MNRFNRPILASGGLAVSVTALLVLLFAGSALAAARIDGISGTRFSLTTGTGEISTPDGGSVHFWGYQDATGAANPFGVPQYPGPTLILNQGDTVTINLSSGLPFGRCTSMVFPGHAVTTGGGDQDGLLTRETCPGGAAVSYTFTATQPGTYTYYSGTEPELQIEMGLVGAIIVRPSMGEDYAYNDANTRFDHEYLFLMTQMDPVIHQLVEQGRFSEVDMARYWPVYWFFNGRAGPDDLADAFVSWLPHQPYNCTPRMTPGQTLLMRLVGGDQGQHPFHYHGNNADIIARDGRLLPHSRSQFTTLSVPGETVDQLFTWTGEKLGWDIYGTPADGMPAHSCVDGDGDGFGDASAGSTFDHEYCADHGKPFPVVLPEQQNLAFGGWWSGSPFMGAGGALPPGEGGLNPNSGYFFMWHSHAEKELTNFDIFPGGMMSMMVVEPPGTPIP